MQTQVTRRTSFPAITFCIKQPMKDVYCDLVTKIIMLSIDTRICVHKNSSNQNDYSIAATIGMRSWRNNKFKIKCNMQQSRNCILSDFKNVKSVSDSCITWNHNGNYYNDMDIPELIMNFKGYYLNVIVHDPNIYGPNQESTLTMTRKSNYELTFDKTIIRRLPAPFSSHCTTQNFNGIFPKSYTRISCIDSIKCIHGYQKCGDTYDFCRSIVPEDIVRKYQRISNISYVRSCLMSNEIHVSLSTCPFACKEIDYDVSVSTYAKVTKLGYNEFVIRLKNRLRNTYKVLEEKEVYSWDSFISESGGLIGVMIGASVLSILEILAFTLVWAAKTLVCYSEK